MRKYCRHFTLSFLSVIFVLTVTGQKNILQNSIYFKTAKYNLTTDSKSILNNLVDSVKTFQSYKILLEGNTDNIGSNPYNQQLSEQRVLATHQYLTSKGINSTIVSTSAYGEEKPIGDNGTEEGKQKNRRVDITISFTRPVDNSKSLPSIFELYRKIERKPQEFCINTQQDTVLRCEQGTIIYVKANSFKVPDSSLSNCITLKIKEDLLESDMIIDNLSTTSNGRTIETQGMVYTEANDANGNKIQLEKGKDLVIFIPSDTIRKDALIFNGHRTPHDSIMNWTVNDNSLLTDVSISDLNNYYNMPEGGILDEKECKFFFCKMRNFFRRLSGKELLPLNPETDGRNLKGDEVQALYDKYGIKNQGGFTAEMNKQLFDSLNVKTLKEFQDTLKKIRLNNIELSIMDKTISYEDLKYYVFNTSELGWRNVDCFSNLNPNRLITMRTNLEPAKNIDCKMVFKRRRVILPATNTQGNYTFGGIPKGEAVWIIAIKYFNNKPYLYMEETTVGDKTVEIEFKEVTLEELKKKMKVLDK